MEDLPIFGVITGEVPTELGLAAAAARQPGVSARTLGAEEPASDAVAGLIVDVPLHERAELLERLASRWRIPILIESPVAADLEHARVLDDLASDTVIVASNPLRYALHTRRLLEDLAQRADDPLATFFAAWRFRAHSTAEHALPQLLDYLSAVCPDELCRISAMQNQEHAVLTVTFRYASDVLGSIELGCHLPANFPSASELVVECFYHSSAYTCVPGSQSVQVYANRGHGAYDWQPDPADAIVAAFAGWQRGAARPVGGINRDLTTLRLVDRIRRAVQTDEVVDVQGGD